MNLVLLVTLVVLGGAPGLDMARIVFTPLQQAGPTPLDGTTGAPVVGPGGAQLQLSREKYLRDRNQALARGEAPFLAALKEMEALSKSGAAERATRRDRIVELTGKPLDNARRDLLVAIRAEERRLWLVGRAFQLAASNAKGLPDVDPKLIERLTRFVTSGKAVDAVDARIRAYRSIAASFVAYDAGDVIAALVKMKAAAEDAPDLALVHVYLGSFYYLIQDLNEAIGEWRKALELDPSNAAVRAALDEHAPDLKKK